MQLEALARNKAAATTVPPAGIRGALVRMYEELLELHPIDPAASFFELGGDSILALRLLLRIERELGRRVAFSVLFERPAATQLAEWMQLAEDGAASDRAVQLRSGTTEPLWLVPPVHGNPLCYLELARRAAPGRPMYSIQVPGLVDAREPLDQLPALASVALAQVRAIQPLGPYTLGGWSFGGVLALEMALQLQAAGETVAGLVVLAATPPSHDHLVVARQIMGDYPVWKMCFMYASQMAHSIGLRLDLAHEYEAFRELDDRGACELLATKLAQIGTVPIDAAHGQIERWARVFRSSLRAFHYYDQPTKFRGRALVLSARHPNPVHHSPMVDRPLPPGDWRNHLEQFDAVKVDGDALNLMARPWVDGVIDAIECWLAGTGA
jgi:thioesterase domain-containing protein